MTHRPRLTVGCCVAAAGILFGFVCGAGSALAEEGAPTLAPHKPSVCVGYNGPEHPQPWGYVGATGCPPEHGVFAAVRVGRTAMRKRTKRVVCCPLPSSDILEDNHVDAMGPCPAGFVVTGSTLAPPADCSGCDLVTRCTEINSRRYQLGPETDGALWGLGASSWKETRRVQKRDIPVAIRFAAGRVSEFQWAPLGCIGLPFGALLVSSDAIECHHFTFRRLEYRGLPGDPRRGTPVKMFPDCSRISSKFEAEPACVR